MNTRLHRVPTPTDPFLESRRLTADNALADEVVSRIEACSALGVSIELPQAAVGWLNERLISDGALFEPTGVSILEQAGAISSIGLLLTTHVTDPKLFSLVYGYALTPDGVWRTRLFGWDKSSRRVVEAGLAQWVAYVGVALNKAESTRLIRSYLGAQGDPASAASVIAGAATAWESATPGTRRALEAVGREGHVAGDILASSPEIEAAPDPPPEHVEHLAVTYDPWGPTPSGALTRLVGDRLAAASPLGSNFEAPPRGASAHYAAFAAEARVWSASGVTRHPLGRRGAATRSPVSPTLRIPSAMTSSSATDSPITAYGRLIPSSTTGRMIDPIEPTPNVRDAYVGVALSPIWLARSR